MPADDVDQGQGQGQSQGRRRILMVLRESVIVVGVVLLLSLIVKTWLVQPFSIPSGSMENTLLVGDQVVVSKLTPSPFSLKRGDVIVFEDPDHWLPAPVPVHRNPLAGALRSTLAFVGLAPSEKENHLIKRVIGLPGDHVVCCDFRKLTVNGVALTEPYLFPRDAPSQEPFDITVPAGRVWVMGDHRSKSGDSRRNDQGSGGVKGSVPEDLIVGRAISVIAPLPRWSWLANPGETFAKVPAATAR